jgi:NAD dependent epimerase/dehydratase
MINDWVGRKTFVTGAGGFIGSHLVEALIERGSSVRAFVRYNSRGDIGMLTMLPPKVLEQVEIISGDLRDLPALISAMDGMEIVFHLGALIAIPYSYRHPAEVVETNVIGTLNILLAGQQTGVERILHTSTSEVYGTARKVPIDEDHPLQGQSPYSASKIGADKLAESFYCAYGLPVITVRPFNTYGPRQSARAVIPSIISQALTKEEIHLGSLTPRRDFTYVMDTVDGFLKAGLVPGIAGETFNLGTGADVSIGDLVTEVGSLLGKTLVVREDPERLRPERSEVMRLLSDNRLARERLDWIPQVGLSEGLSRTIAWITSHMHLYHPQVYQV